jgi:hypothetical protein
MICSAKPILTEDLCVVQEEEFSITCVHRAGLLDVQNILSADTCISQQTEGHSFGDHLISESVRVTPLSVIEASIVLCRVCYDSCESMSNQSMAPNTRYKCDTHT